MRELALIQAIGAALERRDGARVVRWIGDDAAVVRGDAPDDRDFDTPQP